MNAGVQKVLIILVLTVMIYSYNNNYTIKDFFFDFFFVINGK